MNITPEEAFDVIIQRVQEYKSVQLRIKAVKITDSAQGGGPRMVGDYRTEFIADVWKAGKFALGWNKALHKVFDLYCIGGLDAKKVCAAMGHFEGDKIVPMKEGQLWNFLEKVKVKVGEELIERKIFPPTGYREPERTKLTERDEEAIRNWYRYRRRSDGKPELTQRQLAKMYGVGVGTISGIVKRKSASV
jgi:hypothetical protein